MADDATALEGMAGYTGLAKAINLRFGQTAAPYDRRQVETWAKRGTKNAAGVPFPQYVVDLPDQKPRTPHLMHDIRSVLEWAEAGVPRPHGDGFETMAERQARHVRKQAAKSRKSAAHTPC